MKFHRVLKRYTNQGGILHMAYQPKSYKKFVATAATATLVAAALVPVASAASFTDVNSNYKVAVDYLVTKEIAKGTSDTTFGTTASITRGDAAVMIANALDLNTATAPDAGFKDLSTRVAGAVNALAAAKIIGGKSATKFAPDDKITRQEMAKVVSLAYKLDNAGTNNKFVDVNSNWDAYVNSLVKHEVTLGKTPTLFGATQNVTRGEFALFVYRSETLVPATPEVVSVSAINGIQVEVKFNRAVDVASAETLVNYRISNVTGVAQAVNPASAEVLADGKTVLLTLSAAATSKTTFTLAVSDVNIAGSAVTEFPLFTQVVVVDDSTAPVIDSVVSKTNSSTAQSATVYFTEPVTGGAFKINGTTVAYVMAPDGMSATLNGLSLDSSATHTLQVINLTDAAGNINDTATKTFTVTKDVAAPTFALSTESDGKIVLTFDKAVDASTVSAGSLVLKDEALNTEAGYTVNVPAGYSNKRVEISLDPTVTYVSKTTRNFTILASDSIKDTLGNKLVAAQRTVSITKDVVAPVLNSVQYVKDASGAVKFVDFNFSEKVLETAVYGVTAKNTVTGANVDLFGSVGAGTVAVQSNGTTLRVNAAGADVIKSGKLEIATPAGFATDTALTPNNSVVTKTVVDFGTASATSLKVATVAPAGVNQYAVTFDGTVTYASATNPANYTINGVALPANTTIVYDTTGLDDVTITLPAGFVAADDAGAVLRVQNVENSSGVKVSANTNVVTVDDNTGPLFAQAKSAINGNGSFSLGFSEAVNTIGALTDLVFNVNGSNVTIGGATANVAGAAGTGSDAGKYVFTFTTDATTVADASLKYYEYFDVNGNDTYEVGVDITVANSTTALTGKTLNLNTMSGFKVSTIATPTVITDTNAPAANLIKGSQTLTIK
jgi:hypothetical protein